MYNANAAKPSKRQSNQGSDCQQDDCCLVAIHLSARHAAADEMACNVILDTDLQQVVGARDQLIACNV
jgi:hypothetical protein